VRDPHPGQRQPGREIAELLPPPVGRPSHKPLVWYKSFLYQAATGKNRRSIGQGGLLLLGSIDRDLSDATAVWGNGAADCWAASASGVVHP
jgi:hypothetical protein